MNFTSLLYPMLIVICAFIIYSNIKKSRQYKKENMKILLSLNEDDKIMRTMSSLMLAFIILSSIFSLSEIARTKGLLSLDAIYIFVLPVLFIVLYLPLSKKTSVTTLGIIKKSNLVRWEDIKGIDYAKELIKGKQVVRIIYRGSYKDMLLGLNFKPNDEQLESFRNIAKECRNNKKDKNKEHNKEHNKDKKNGK